MVQCCIVNERNEPVNNCLVVLDGEALQLTGNCLSITVGKHHIKVMHRDYVAEEGTLNVTDDINIILGGSTSLLS